mmetsp:Transcript_46319/g.91804  ORF Transcript_46319/g.91804 Transcript_46319/m.91804 type:complete len:174 (-) Transcript_46319:105-626(-)
MEPNGSHRSTSSGPPGATGFSVSQGLELYRNSSWRRQQRVPPEQVWDGTPTHPAGVPTARDLVGAPAIGGVLDFGLDEAPQPRGKRTDVLQISAASVLLNGPLSARNSVRDEPPLTGVQLAFTRRPLLQEGLRITKHRHLRSDPKNLGFVYPPMHQLQAMNRRAGDASGMSRT